MNAERGCEVLVAFDVQVNDRTVQEFESAVVA